MSNYFISYDLNTPGQGYDRVISVIKTLGGWAKVHKSFWYVNSTLSIEQIVQRVWGVMDRNDSLFVVDVANKNASWQNIAPEAAQYIRDTWYK